MAIYRNGDLPSAFQADAHVQPGLATDGGYHIQGAFFTLSQDLQQQSPTAGPETLSRLLTREQHPVEGLETLRFLRLQLLKYAPNPLYPLHQCGRWTAGECSSA